MHDFQLEVRVFIPPRIQYGIIDTNTYCTLTRTLSSTRYKIHNLSNKNVDVKREIHAHKQFIVFLTLIQKVLLAMGKDHPASAGLWEASGKWLYEEEDSSVALDATPPAMK